jgi:hypothetical protein
MYYHIDILAPKICFVNQSRLKFRVFLKSVNHHPPWPPFLKGGKYEELDVLRVITRNTSNSSLNSPPHSWVGGGVESLQIPFLSVIGKIRQITPSIWKF